MTSVPMDALASFVHLTDHIPTWISNLDSLATHVAIKHEEFAAEYRRVLEHARPKRKKSPSVASVRTNDGQRSVKSQKKIKKKDVSGPDTATPPQLADISPLDPANKYLFANARRGKRRQGTSIRSGASGPPPFRNQQQVIIYYDSSLQHAFEALVRDIGTARNNLRKAKQARVLEQGLAFPFSTTGSYGRRGWTSMRPNPTQSFPNSNLSVEPKSLLKQSVPDGEISFDEVANDLGDAQSLCETAAHQFLRDGDCTSEINRIRTICEKVLQVAQLQVEALEKERNKDGNLDSDTKPQSEQAEKVEKADHPLVTVVEKLGPDTTPSTKTDHAVIEVDSDDDDDEVDLAIDISAFRTMRGAGLRA